MTVGIFFLYNLLNKKKLLSFFVNDSMTIEKAKKVMPLN